MYVALTGTPGTGKSSAAALLSARGFSVVSVAELAKLHGAAEAADGEMEIDTEKLAAHMHDPEGIVVVDGHLAHHLPNDICIILRCHPEVLRERLGPRKYVADKVMENLEAEAIDLILQEALEACGRVFEIDTTEMEPEEVADAIERIINGDGDEYSPGKIDWSGAVMDWY